MEKIKHILNILFNPKYITPEEKVRRIKYLDQFKRRYDDMNISEKIMTASLYSIEYCCSDTLLHLGRLEATLIMLKVLDDRNTFSYEGWDAYKDNILRLTKEYLTKTGCYGEESKSN
jgi:hypothetical protein